MRAPSPVVRGEGVLVDDFILRQIQKIADLVAAIAGSPHGRLPEGLLAQIRQAYADLLGMDADLVDSFDAETLRRSLHTPEEHDALIDLLLAHAEVSARQGDEEGAARRLAKAIALMPGDDARRPGAEERLVGLYA